MSEPKTAGQWLEQKDLPTELAKVLTPGPWKHGKITSDDHGFSSCGKCGEMLNAPGSKVYCPVPNPIKTEGPEAWGVAMEWFRSATKDEKMLSEVMNAVAEKKNWDWWWIYYAQPKHYLIAAAIAAERSKE